MLAPTRLFGQELARGGDLATKIDRHKKAGTFVPEDEVWRICIDVCKVGC